MLKLLKGLFVSAALLASLGQASAASITEDIFVSYLTNSGSPFTIFSLSLVDAASPATNFLSGFSGATFSGSGGAVYDTTASLISGDNYTFSYIASFGTGSQSVLASSSGITGALAGNSVGSHFFITSATLSPVPLPASFPLFALALIGLGAFGYHTARRKSRVVVVAS